MTPLDEVAAIGNAVSPRRVIPSKARDLLCPYALPTPCHPEQSEGSALPICVPSVVSSRARRGICFANWRVVPSATEVFPNRVVALDQGNLFFASPCLDLLFSLEGGKDIIGLFEVDDPIYPIAGRQFRSTPLFVLKYTADKISGHTDIQYARTTGEDVNEVATHPASKADSSLRSE